MKKYIIPTLTLVVLPAQKICTVSEEIPVSTNPADPEIPAGAKSSIWDDEEDYEE